MMIPTRQPYSFSGAVATLCFFFLFSFALHTLASPSLHYCRQDQRDALLEFKHEFLINESNPSPIYRSSWNEGNDCCFWHGVECDDESGKVISLFFYFDSLNNTLKPNSGLFKLRYLQRLQLSNCNLYGEIPSSFGNLSHLTELDLSRNKLDGTIPESISKFLNLEKLDLSYNKIIGPIPTSLSQLVNLTYLDLSNNKLEGEVPGFKWRFGVVKLSHNSFSSFESSFEVEEFGEREHVELELDLGSNLFRGPFPHWICKLTSKLSLDLSNNRFSGSIPQCLRNFTNFPRVLILRNNSFSGTLPVMSADALVEAFDFSGNRFSGKIPKSIGLLEKLRILNLSSNALTRDIPQSLTDLKNLEVLDLSQNQLFGQIPPDLAKLNSLLIMNFSHNNLEGPVPQGPMFLNQNCSSFMDNPKLYGLEKICGKTLPKEEQVITWIAAAISIGYGPGVLCGFVIGHIFVSHKFRRINPRVVIRSAR